jgi:hypothetical protein
MRYRLRPLLPLLIVALVLAGYYCVLALFGSRPQLIFANAAIVAGAIALLTPAWYPIYRMIVFKLNITVHRSGEVRPLDTFDFLQATAYGTCFGAFLLALGQTLRDQ